MKELYLLWIWFLPLLLNAQQDIRVYVFLAEECPISIYMVQPLNQVVEQYGGQADFFAVFPKSNSSEATATAFADRYQMKGFSNILDVDQALSKRLDAVVTPEVIILDKQDKVLYKGRISNAYAAPGKMRHGSRVNDLDRVLGLILKGQPVPKPWPDAVGCFITFNQNP